MSILRKEISTTKSFDVIKAPMKLDDMTIEDRYFVDFVTTTTYINRFSGKPSLSTQHRRDGMAFLSIEEAKNYAMNVEKPSEPCYCRDETEEAYATSFIFPKGHGKIYQQLIQCGCGPEILDHFNEMFECYSRKNLVTGKQETIVMVSTKVMMKYFYAEFMSTDHYKKYNDMEYVDSYFSLDKMCEMFQQKNIANLIKGWTHKTNFTNIVASFSQTPLGVVEMKTSDIDENMKELARQEIERIEKYKEVLNKIIS